MAINTYKELEIDIYVKYNNRKLMSGLILLAGIDKNKIDNIISVIVAIADALSALRPGARNDSLENYIKRLEQLEKIAMDIKGVDKTFAVQAGRELRVIVKPDEVDDLESYKIARDIKEKIEGEMQYPGTIKVTVIREVRAQEEAR